jgi:DNA-binding MarR family transcriptional regulator
MDLKQVFNDLVRFETELWDGVDRRLREELDLSVANYDVLVVIGRTPSCRVYDVASELAITVGGASKAVDRIEALGHCVRRSHPEDRRSSIVELTPAGRKLLARATPVFEAELATWLRGPLSGPALDQFARTLVKLRAGEPRMPR